MQGTRWHVLDDLELPPASLLFVDDWPPYVQAAIQLGLQGVAIVRGDHLPPSDTPWISDLSQIDDLIDQEAKVSTVSRSRPYPEQSSTDDP